MTQILSLKYRESVAGIIMKKSRKIVTTIILLMIPGLAYAQVVSGSNSPQTMINNVCVFILGPFGQSLAILSIVGIGFLFMLGRASLGIIASVVGGIVIMFGASYLGKTLIGGG